MASRRAHRFDERSIAMATRQQRIAVLASGLLLCLLASVAPAAAQSSACTLVPDKRNPNDKILRCGTELTVTPAPGTVYRPGPAGADGLPTSVQLDSGALLIEFNPKRRHEFQILTPQAIASVRGTKWAMDVTGMQTSTLVLAGEVAVARKNEAENVLVGPGQGVDIEIPPGGIQSRSLSPYRPDPITVKQWGSARVKELLDRFGP
jgi:FecR protein